MKQLLLTLLVVASVVACTPKETYRKNSGFVFGTMYNIVYKSDKDLQQEILDRLKIYDASLSTYNKESIISRINRNEDVEVDTFFMEVFNQAQYFHQLSEGAFDITVKPLSMLWKFGGQRPDTITIAQYDSLVAIAQDSISAFVGMDKVKLEGRRVVKDDPRIMLDANALAEGCGIDIAASVLDEHGVTDYMVEIGGELRLKGVNQKGERWRIGIDRPTADNDILNRKMQKVLSLTDCAVSTSGWYRQYYMREDGLRLTHIIHPKTGCPIKPEVESVTVVGPNTMTTDALATTFSVVGIEKTREIVSNIEGIDVYIYYLDENGAMQEIELHGREKE